jgi:hypothetical protein
LDSLHIPLEVLPWLLLKKNFEIRKLFCHMCQERMMNGTQSEGEGVLRLLSTTCPVCLSALNVRLSVLAV